MSSVTVERFRRRFTEELRAAPRAFFWLGALCFALNMIVTFYPGAEQGAFTASAVLTAFGLLVPRWS